VWWDSWRNRDRVLRYRGDCVTCAKPTWGFDDGENDPRGVLGETGTWAFDPWDYDLVGPTVAMCALCANVHESWSKGMRQAEAVWATATPLPTEVAVPAAPRRSAPRPRTPHPAVVEQLTLPF